MRFPKVARYSKVMVNANEFLLEEKINFFPIDPFTIIKKNKWGLITYTELANEWAISLDEVIEAVQSEDGYTIYDGINHTIAYNDTKIKSRIRFTLMHEIGHIYMKHLVDFDETILNRSLLTEQKYKILENEVNVFARNVLSPVMIVKDLQIKSVDDLVYYFGISKFAAKVRLETVFKDYRNLLAPFIQFQRVYFKSFIYTCTHSNHCKKCSHHFVSDCADYCPICGHSLLINKKGEKRMKYTGFQLDKNSRSIICPKCENEKLDYEGDICKICGTNIVNKCEATYRSDDGGYPFLAESCGTLLEGDARFCIKCGNQSTFFSQELLNDWKDEKNEKEGMKIMPF